MPTEAEGFTDPSRPGEGGSVVGQDGPQFYGGAIGTVSVTGTGAAEAAPDLMVVSIGVECRAESVEAAWSRAGSSSDTVASTFRRHGVAGGDIRTTGLNVRADLVWREGEGQSVTGYVAASTLTVRLRAPGSASAVISDAVQAGGNDVRLNGLELTFADDAEVRARAREAAWLDALRSAQQFARLASGRLGRVLSITDTVAPQPPVPLPRMQRAASVEALSVEAGETSASVAIRVVWELEA
ncbi:SIMPL domain-containing protein [Arthrobacter sp. W4I7]|uniref:SIMPL domain-containing protein n=1 Tax=Arthrobacter sp. W4I7 TaxID=3042296 RepID=UPI002781FA12|nr:SIMPL domain-containing protein [Arthrobacter sp. W4I7]MDQ0691695.1 uncharacterized protein YggE [Arthrobacter sp. W4I7]